MPDKYIPLTDCKPRMVYRIYSRNLGIGVFNPKDNGFIGIRTKFGQQYLFTEHHWDTGAPYGTAYPLEEIGPLPDDIVLCEYLDTIDKISKRAIVSDPSLVSDKHINGWYRFKDTGEICESYPKISPIMVGNDKMFEYLENLTKTQGEKNECN